jgi:hypothetical protein
MNKDQMREYLKEYLPQYRKTYANKRINLTVSEDEYEVFVKANAGKATGLPRFVKRQALARLQETPNVPPLNEATAKEALRLIRTMANNLNQVAHQVNASRLEAGPGYQPSEKMLADMRDSLAAMQQQVAGLLTPSQDSP